MRKLGWKYGCKIVLKNGVDNWVDKIAWKIRLRQFEEKLGEQSVWESFVENFCEKNVLKN